ncbi:hypothetical protein CKY20_11460 [Capnocytophaga canis]|uniref:Lipoprotein n=1 Tax=Capnocytophaga canis TaxID=1848903 RepID=A0A3A1YFP2_9FLAO|nr:hypothetical protein [Capnocytophaga canis]RIY35044.1 hypothetical protein CKY20_11460 [Capnocytophaga canis]
MTITKVFGIFFSLIFLFSCVEKKKLDKDLEIQRIDIFFDFFENCEPEIQWKNGRYYKGDSIVKRIDCVNNFLLQDTYAMDENREKYVLKESRKWKNIGIYKPSIFNHIPLEYIEKNKKYYFEKKEFQAENAIFYFKDGTKTYWHFDRVSIYGFRNFNDMIKNYEYGEAVVFFNILSSISSYIYYLDSEQICKITKEFAEYDFNREVLRRYEQ